VNGFTPAPVDLTPAETPRQPGKRRRRGTVTTELMLTLPLLITMLFGTIQFSMVLFAKQQVQAAAWQGARTAARGGKQQDILQAVNHYLSGASLAGASVSLGQVDSDGNLLGPDGNPLESGNPVTVEVDLPGASAAPGLLRAVGLRFLESTVVARTIMCKE
jgi:Flp pilus assembly protein TadG